MVRDRDHVYELNGAESRVLANHQGGLEDLRDAGLVRSTPVGPNKRAVFLTNSGAHLPETHCRDIDERPHEPRQAFRAGLRTPRELVHAHPGPSR
jgi:hypothetical protein